MHRRSVLKAGLSIAAMAPFWARAAEPDFPSRALKLVVPFPPGGPTDIFGRKYGEQASIAFGQQVVIENRAGAGGTIGASHVANAKTDGYTLLFGTSSTHVTSPLLMATPPYDPVKDFTLIRVGVVPMILVVRPDFPASNVAEFVELLKANPGKYTFSSAGPGSINHLGIELLKQKAGLNALHVPYKGTNPAQMAVMAGEVDFLFDTFGTALAPHEAGRFRILATCGENRSPSAPDIPTMIESGYPEVIVSTVNLVALPAGTPKPVIDAIARVTGEVMRDEAMIAALRALSIEPITDADPVASADFFRKEIARWAPIVKASGVTL